MKMRKFYRGFTLIELIVVVAILAVLVGIAAPMMFNYLRSGDLVKCRSNMEELAKLGVKYSQDIAHQNMLPTSGMADDEDTREYDESEGWWLDLAQGLDSTVLPRNRKGKMKIATIFHCPGDLRASVDKTGVMEADTTTVSYVSWTDGSADPENPNSQIRTVGRKHLDTLPWLSDGVPVKGKSVVDYKSFLKMVMPAMERHSDTLLVVYASGIVSPFKFDMDDHYDPKDIFRKINPDKQVPEQKKRK